jgi:ApbE superfamily uncharacterized protein (UPF0280 family)
MGPTSTLLDEGHRLHLQHGPIDLIIGADPTSKNHRATAFQLAATAFETVLEKLVEELPLLQSAISPKSPAPKGQVALRMDRAVRPHCTKTFVTPMAAVAGAVADQVLAAMAKAMPLKRAYVNNGGDIALYLAPAESFSTAIFGLQGLELGRIKLSSQHGVGGIASSGQGGRSLSFGIADSVTVLAANAAVADVAATLIGNAVDLPNHPAVTREMAIDVKPDTDLGDRLVVTNVGILSNLDIITALSAGHAVAEKMLADGQIKGAALFLRGKHMVTGPTFSLTQQ